MVEGPYKRLCIWFQGCNRNCQDCCNKELQEFKQKNIISLELLCKIIKEAKDKYHIEGVTLSGGEPLLQIHLKDLLFRIKEMNLGIIMFTGFILNDIPTDIKNLCDIIIDGPFERDKLDNTRLLIGSLNQNINCISDRYNNDKNWYYNKSNLIEEINISESIIFNGDKI